MAAHSGVAFDIGTATTRISLPATCLKSTGKLILKILEDQSCKRTLLNYYNYTHSPQYAANPCADNMTTLPAANDAEPQVFFHWSQNIDSARTQFEVDQWLFGNLRFRVQSLILTHQWACLCESGGCHHSSFVVVGDVDGGITELVRLFYEDISPENFEHSLFADLLGLRPIEAEDKAEDTRNGVDAVDG